MEKEHTVPEIRKVLTLISHNPLIFTRIPGVGPNERNQAWANIARHTLFPGTDGKKDGPRIKIMWKGLLKEYISYLRKITMNYTPRPHFRWAAELEFMQAHLLTRPKTDSENDTDTDEDVDLPDEMTATRRVILPTRRIQTLDEKRKRLMEPMESSMIRPISRKVLEAARDAAAAREAAKEAAAAREAERGYQREAHYSGGAAASSNTPASAAPNGNITSSFTSTELMFLGFAKAIEAMPKAVQSRAKRKIFEVIQDLECNHLEDQ